MFDFLFGVAIGVLPGLGVWLFNRLMARRALRRRWAAAEQVHRVTGVEVDPYDPHGLIAGKW